MHGQANIDNEIYLLIKYIKSALWRVAKCLSYIEEGRCLKVNVSLYVSSSLTILVQLLTKKGLVYSPFSKFWYNTEYFCQLYVGIPVFLIITIFFAFYLWIRNFFLSLSFLVFIYAKYFILPFEDICNAARLILLCLFPYIVFLQIGAHIL